MINNYEDPFVTKVIAKCIISVLKLIHIIVDVNSTVVYIIFDVYNRWKKRYSWRKQYIEISVHWKKKIVSWRVVLNESLQN
jgi:hypothetical protein